MPVGSEFKAIIPSARKKFPALCLEIVPCIFSLIFFFVFCFVRVVSMQVVHMLRTFHEFVLASIAFEGGWCKWTVDVHASVLLAQGVSSFWYTFVFVIAAKDAITYELVFVYGVFTILCSHKISGWSTGASPHPHSVLKSWPLCLVPTLWHLSTKAKPKACYHLLELEQLQLLLEIFCNLTISRASFGFFLLANSSVKDLKRGEPLGHHLEVGKSTLTQVWKRHICFVVEI